MRNSIKVKKSLDKLNHLKFQNYKNGSQDARILQLKWMGKISNVAEGIVRNLMTKQRLLLHLNFELVSMEKGKLILKIPYTKMAQQDEGIFQRGVISTLGDVAAGLAACTVMQNPSHSAITLEFKINFLQPGTRPYLMANGSVIKETKSLIFTEAQIYDADQNMCAYLYQTIKRVTPQDNPSIKVV